MPGCSGPRDQLAYAPASLPSEHSHTRTLSVQHSLFDSVVGLTVSLKLLLNYTEPTSAKLTDIRVQWNPFVITSKGIDKHEGHNKGTSYKAFCKKYFLGKYLF